MSELLISNVSPDMGVEPELLFASTGLCISLHSPVQHSTRAFYELNFQLIISENPKISLFLKLNTSSLCLTQSSWALLFEIWGASVPDLPNHELHALFTPTIHVPTVFSLRKPLPLLTFLRFFPRPWPAYTSAESDCVIKWLKALAALFVVQPAGVAIG